MLRTKWILTIAITCTTLYIAQSQICEFTQFVDLNVGSTYVEGDIITSNALKFDVQKFYPTIGSCSGNSTSNSATVDNGDMSCTKNNVIFLNNVNLYHTSNDPIEKIILRYGYYGGSVNLTVNDECASEVTFPILNNTVLGGTDIKVFDNGGCGEIIIEGTINSFAIGGQELALDNIIICAKPCPANSYYSDFNNISGSYPVGSSFSSGPGDFTVEEFYWNISSCTNVFTGGSVYEDDNFCVQGEKSIGTNNVNVHVDYGSDLSFLKMSFVYSGGNINLRINGDCVSENFPSDLPTSLGGVQVLSSFSGGCETLYLNGLITDISVGGQEFWINDITACESMPIGTTDHSQNSSATLIHSIAPNPFRDNLTLKYDQKLNNETKISLLTSHGQQVSIPFQEMQDANLTSIAWETQSLNKGVYLIILESQNRKEIKKVIKY